MLASTRVLDRMSSTDLIATFAALFEQLSSGVAYCRIEHSEDRPTDFTYLYTNTAFHELTGFGSVEGKFVSELIPEIHKTDQWLIDLYERVAMTGKSESFESRVDSLQQWYSVQVTCPRSGHFLAIFKVENERRRVEEELRKSEAKFRGLVTQNHAIILQIEPKSGKILDANQAAVAFYGWSHAELCAMNIQDINALNPDDVARERQLALQEQRKYFVFPHRIANGEIRTVEVHSTPIDVSSNPILVSIVHDITPRVLAEQRLKEILAEQQAILTSEIVGIVKLSDRKFEWLNKPFARMLGYTQEELLLKPTRMLYTSEEDHRRFAELAYPVMQSGGTFHTEWQYVNKDGTARWYEISGSLLCPESDQSVWSFQDITDRRLAQESLENLTQALKVSEGHLALAQSIAKIGSWHVDFGNDESEERWTVSNEIRCIYGHPLDLDIKAETGFSLMPKEDQEFTQRAWSAAKSGIGPYAWRHRIVVGGKTKWIQVVCKFEFDSDGRALEASGTNQDITETKQLEDVRSEAINRLMKIASRVPGVVYQYRLYPDGRSCFPFASEGIQDIYRVKPEDVVDDASPVFSKLHPDDLALVSASIQESANNLTPWQQEYRVKFEDGTVRWVHGNAVPEREAGGSVLWHGFIADVTERRKAEELVRKLSTAVEQSPASIVITDIEANIEYVNPQFTATTGYSLEEVTGKNPRIIQSKLTPPETYANMWDTLTSGNAWLGQLINKRKNGEIYWEESHIAPVKSADETITHYVAVKADVSDRVRNAERIDSLMRDQQAMLNNDLVGIVKAKDRHIIWANSAFEKMLGYTSGELNGSSTRQNFSSEHEYEEFGSAAYAVLRGGNVFRTQTEHRCKDGKVIWVDISGEQLSQASGESLWSFVDITERKAAEGRLILSEAKIKGVLECAADAIFITDQNGKYLYTNQEASRLLGYTRQEFELMSIPDITPLEELPEVLNQFQALLQTGNLRVELKLKRKDGSAAPVELNASILPDGTVFGSCRDIAQRKQMEDQIRELAFHDTLTTLPNRRLLLDRLRQALAASKRTGRHGAILFLDLDNFKPLNDMHGHEMGDKLLVEVASRLSQCVREVDTVARFGGDEFVVMLSDLKVDREASISEAQVIAEKIRASLAEPYLLTVEHCGMSDTKVVHRCSASIGVSLFLGHEATEDDVLNGADSAMYQAKAEGRNAWRLFAPEMQSAVLTRAQLESDLREAVQMEQWRLYYQAQVDSKGCIRGVEALIRWQHPKQGLALPATFISVAEDTGVIIPMGHWVLETACRQLSEWSSQSEFGHLTIAVNVSARQFHRQDFVEQVLNAIQRTGANPSRLKLELTESILVSNIDDVVTKMCALKAKGVGFSLDDFGTGYSSLSYLKRLPLDQLKIDQGFVRDILTDPNDASIAKMVIALADSLGLSVIAEGVETSGQRDFLFDMGCHAYQGYLFSRPVPNKEFENLFESVLNKIARPCVRLDSRADFDF